MIVFYCLIYNINDRSHRKIDSPDFNEASQIDSTSHTNNMPIVLTQYQNNNQQETILQFVTKNLYPMPIYEAE